MMTPDPGDSILAVRFFRKPVQNQFMTNAEGRPIMHMADFVRIEIPGNMLSIIEDAVGDHHKQRFPMQWAQYLNEQAAGHHGGEVQGTLLRDWPLLTAAQAEELKHFKFYTVEQVAAASDSQINSVGMVIGMAPFSFREKAKAFLAKATDSAFAQRQADELLQRDQKIADLQAQMQRQAEQMQKLLAGLAEREEKRGPGRPRKEVAEA